MDCSEGDTYLPDHSWYRDAVDECPIYKSESLGVTERLSGVTLSLCSDWSSNYGHLVFDALPRIHLFEQGGYTWDDVKQIIVPDFSSPGKRAMAQRCGIPLHKAVTLGSNAVVECEDLIVPTLPNVRRNTPPWVAAFWHKKAPRVEQTGRRLFISRRGSARTLINEDALTPVLEEFGFEMIVSSDKGISKRYPEAKMVMGPHGAALADVVFCHPGSVLIELTPPGHIFPYYYTTADSAGMEYFSILGRYPAGDVRNTMTADFIIEPAELRAAILSAEAVLQGDVANVRDESSLRSIA